MPSATPSGASFFGDLLSVCDCLEEPLCPLGLLLFLSFVILLQLHLLFFLPLHELSGAFDALLLLFLMDLLQFFCFDFVPLTQIQKLLLVVLLLEGFALLFSVCCLLDVSCKILSLLLVLLFLLVECCGMLVDECNF